MPRLRYLILSGVFFAAAAACWTIQHAADAELTERDHSKRQLAAQLALLEQTNRALSNTLAQASTCSNTTAEELREASCLRKHIATLRQSLTEIDSLRERNCRHLAQLDDTAGSEPVEVTADTWQNTDEFLARDRFAFAGFAEPESAMKTTLWMWVDADLPSLLAQCTPDERGKLEQVWAQRSQTEMAALQQRMAAMYGLDRGGVRLVGKKLTAPDHALVDVYFEGDGKRRRFSLQKSGEQWAVEKLVAIYN